MKTTWIVAIIAVVAIVIAGGAVVVTNSDNDKTNGGSVTVVDFLGREVTITSTDRIVSVSSTGTAILCGLGVGSNIVGVSSDSSTYEVDPYAIGQTQDDFPKIINDGLKSGKIKSLGGTYNISAEAIASVQADLVVGDTLNIGASKETQDALDALGVNYMVVASSNTRVDGIYEKIELLGKAVGKESAAERIISEMESTIKKICDWCGQVVENERNGEKYNVALMMTATIAIGWNYPGGSVMDGLCVNNVFESVGTYATVSKESIANANPDVLIYQTLGMGDGVTDPVSFVNSLYSDPIIGATKAANSGLIFTTIDGAKTTCGLANQDFVNAYAIYAMFIYKDYLTFDIPDVFDTENYASYTSQFWEMINS